MKLLSRMIFAAALLSPAAAIAQTPSPSPAPGGQSEYVFRFNPALSTFMIDSMDFKEREQLDLGSCTSTRLTEGPITCARNCEGTPACLLLFSGPSGWSTNEVLEKLEEERVGASGASAIVDALNARH